MVHRSKRVPLLALCALAGMAGPSRGADDDPKEIVRRALRMTNRNRELERSYTYTLRDEERTLDSAGAVKRTESKTWEVIPLQGAQFRRLMLRNDKPLSPKEERQQEAIRQKREAERRKNQEMRANETPEQRQKRQEARERGRKQEEKDIDDILGGFDLRLVGEEQVDEKPVWVIEGTPRKGYKFQSRMASAFFSKMQGRMWVSKSDGQPVRIDAECIGTISFGAILARIHQGTRIHMEYTYVNGEVWLPKRESFTASARILLVKGFHVEGEQVYSNYKKFTADSRIVESEK